MRLTCPNCDAQYEVPDEVVPSEGRDVQCSNCGQTWFQHHPDHTSEESEHAAEVDAPSPDEEVSPPPPPVSVSPEPERKQLDPAVTDILRQEAEAEHEARRQRQSEPLESQPDLGLAPADEQEETERRTKEARKRMARLRGEPDPIDAADAAAISSRRDLLPDIEEINSTLRNDDERSGSGDDNVHLDSPTTKKRKRGFRRGFFMALILLAILAVIYIYAPQIAKAVPQLDPLLSAYVGWVDQARLWLDAQVQAVARWLDTVASQSGS